MFKITSSVINFLLFAIIVVFLINYIIFSPWHLEMKQYVAGLSFTPVGGCAIFPSDNIWNYDITGLPVHPNSTNYINSFAANTVHSYFSTGPGNGFPGTPYIIVPTTQPLVPIHITTYATESDPGPYPVPTNAPIEDYGSLGSDQHVLVVQSGTCKLYELYLASPNADGSWNSQSAAVFDLASNTLRPEGWTSADGAGLPIFPGLVRYDEVANGQISHALRFLLPHTQTAHVWPARHHDGSTPDTKYPPEGIRLRLKASVNIDSYPLQSKIILTALKKYGMFLADQSGDTGFVDIGGAPDSRWNLTDLNSLSNLHFSDFEAVDESMLQVSPNSGQVKSVMQSPNPQLTISLTPNPTSGQATILSLTIGLHGIGTGGDNANPTGQGNATPKHTTRTVTVTLYDLQNTQAGVGAGTVTFNLDTGLYKGSVVLSSLQTGDYQVKFQTDGFLTKRLPQILHITQGQVITLPVVSLVNGDIDTNNQIDILD